MVLGFGEEQDLLNKMRNKRQTERAKLSDDIICAPAVILKTPAE